MQTLIATKTYSLQEALFIAAQIRFHLSLLCEKIEVAGSIRRRADQVKDIEIVCIPNRVEKQIPGNMFPEPVNAVRYWIEHSGNPLVKRIKGKDRYQKIEYDGFPIDIYMTTPREYGRILAIRTGPARYSKLMAKRWKELGYEGINGELIHRQTGQRSPEFPDEQSFFDFLNWNYYLPEHRR